VCAALHCVHCMLCRPASLWAWCSVCACMFCTGLHLSRDVRAARMSVYVCARLSCVWVPV
jgi:hypothetical protein